MKKIKLKIKADELRKKLNIKDGINGKDGIDGKTPVIPITEIVSKASNSAYNALLPKIPTITQITQELPQNGESVRDSLEMLTGDERLDKSAIRGLDEFQKKSDIVLGGYGGLNLYVGGSKIGATKTIDFVGPTFSKVNGRETLTFEGDTDEKVKLSALDPTAGYLNDKLSASDGIAYNNGAFTNTDKGSDVDLSGYVPYTGATTDLNLGNHKISAGSVDITIGNVESGSATQNGSGSAFYAYGNYFNFTVYAYKTVGAGRVYSSTPFSIDFYDDYSGNPYSIDVSWGAVVGADGYKIVLTDYNYGYYGNYYTEVTTNSLSYTGSGTYEDPVVVTPNIIAGIAGVFDGNVNIDGALDVSGNIYGSAFIKDGGTSAQFLKADGSVDTSTYLTSESDPLSVLATGSRAGATSQSQAFTNGITLNATSIVTDTTTGLKIGTGTTQKIGFYNNTPIVKPTATTDLGTVLSNLGLRVAGTEYPITTSGTSTFSGTLKHSGSTLSFYNATGITKPAATVDLGTVLSNLGLRTAGTAYPLTTSGAVNLSGIVIIDRTDTEALLVRKASDGGDVFTVDTTNSKIIVGGAVHQIGFTGEEDHFVFTTGLSTSTYQTLFADKILFTQTDGNEYIDSLADGYMDYGATTAHRFLANVKLTADSRKLLFGAGDDMSVYYDGTSGYIKTSEVAASDLHVSCGTDKTLVLDESVWEDIQFPIITGKVPAANFPTWETFTTNTEAYAFSVDDKIQLAANEPPHSWKEGTNGSAHIHFAIKTAQNSGEDRFAKFELIFAYADYNGTWTEQAALTAEATIPTGSAALKNFLLTDGTVTLTGLHLGSQITCRVKRIAATGGTEYADDVYITQVGLHVENDTLGSRSITAK